jgi:hypothetical protein
MTGAKGKYTSELVQEICDRIRADGRLESVYTSPKLISKASFYAWLKTKPDFLDSVNQARQDYQRSQPEFMQSLAQKVLLEYLEGHGKEEIERSSQTIRKFRFKGNEGLQLFEIDEVETVKTTYRRCPVRVLEMFFPRPMAIEKAVETLASEGVLSESQLKKIVIIIEETQTKIKEVINHK